MPEICRFLGILITMYHNEHAPPHFHAEYDEFSIVVDINTGKVLRGRFPRRQLNHLMKWYKIHPMELMENWQLARDEMPLKRIEAL